MKIRERMTFLFIVLLALALAACTSAEPNLPETGEEVLPSEAVLAAQQWLAGQINVAVEDVEILEEEQVVWADSCLELGQLNESCLAAETPGWRAVFDVNGQTYEVRTDETGTVVRLASPVGTPEGTPN